MPQPEPRASLELPPASARSGDRRHLEVVGEFGWQPGARLCAKHQPQQVRRGCEPEILLRLAFSTVALHRQRVDAPGRPRAVLD